MMLLVVVDQVQYQDEPVRRTARCHLPGDHCVDTVRDVTIVH